MRAWTLETADDHSPPNRPRPPRGANRRIRIGKRVEVMTFIKVDTGLMQALINNLNDRAEAVEDERSSIYKQA